MMIGRNVALLGIALTFAAGCTSAKTYTQYMQGPPLEYAQAKCRMTASSVDRGYVAFGNAGHVAGAAIGNAIGNAVRQQEYIKNCLAVHGWREDPPGTKKASTPLPSAGKPSKRKGRRGLQTGDELGIPRQLVARP